jgi:maltose alpha-D-glucosyltransferase/alpha-amylase
MATRSDLPTFTVRENWEEIFQAPAQAALESLLPDFIRRRRWFGNIARAIRSAGLRAVVRIPCLDSLVFFTLVQIDFAQGEPAFYALPLTLVAGSRAEAIPVHESLARLDGAVSGILVDALADAAFAATLLEAIGGNKTFQSDRGQICATSTSHYATLRGPADFPLVPRISLAEQSNTSIIFGDKLIMKCFRRLQEGINPDLEISSYLSRQGFLHTPAMAGTIEFHNKTGKEPVTLAILQAFVPNQGDAWQHTLKELGQFHQEILAKQMQVPEIPTGRLLDLAQAEPPDDVRQRLGPALDSAWLLGQRTAELHLALAGGKEPDFVPEPFTHQDQQALFEDLCELHGRAFSLLQSSLAGLSQIVREEARQLLDRSETIPGQLQRMVHVSLTGQRIRCHGDYHLGQVLFTGKDFVIIDFEGEPTRPLAERRQKTSPLRDVAGMIRSFHYAAHSPLPDKGGLLPKPGAQFWYSWNSATFLRAYLAIAASGTMLPDNNAELKLLLDTYLWEKAMYELAYELNHRPAWVGIPLRGINQLLLE